MNFQFSQVKCWEQEKLASVRTVSASYEKNCLFRENESVVPCVGLSHVNGEFSPHASVPGIGPGSSPALTRINQLLKLRE